MRNDHTDGGLTSDEGMRTTKLEELRQRLIEKARQSGREFKVRPDTIEEVVRLIRGIRNPSTIHVMYLFWIGGMRKSKDVAEAMGISAARVSQILRDDFSHIRDVLLRAGALGQEPEWRETNVVRGGLYQHTFAEWCLVRDVLFPGGKSQSGSNVRLSDYRRMAGHAMYVGETDNRGEEPSGSWFSPKLRYRLDKIATQFIREADRIEEEREYEESATNISN